MRPAGDIERAMEGHADAVWRAAHLHLREPQDIQDAFQETFMRYALADDKDFTDEEHRKAWLIHVARNVCRDMLKASARQTVPLDEPLLGAKLASHDAATQPGSFRNEVIDAMRALDDPPRTPLYLAIVEEYPATLIAEAMEVPVNTVYSWIARGKQKLREALS